MGQRKNSRTKMVLPLRVWGTDANGNPFVQLAHTLDVSAHGARLAGFRAALSSAHPTAKSRAEGSDTIVLAGQAPGFALRRTLEWVEQRKEQWKYPELWDKDGRRVMPLWGTGRGYFQAIA